ncbi:MAG: nicotinate (nicotinamide) nucleotide adenylyltransferase [Candidatus Omnitrophica bacterium]|nr:nicotinate (nicotinamide) nucleotide adenylyltransferase [Candidatus Omnitrophota bacterium]
MKIGILGGTFNPLHYGHLILGEYVRDYLKLDKVIFIPCNIPPHKAEDRLLSSKLRLRLLKVALKKSKYFRVKSLEIDRGGISYTVDTLLQIKKMYPKDKLFLIIGSDLFKGFGSWHKPKTILKLAKVVVVLREALRKKSKGFIFISMPKIEISSSLIRKRIKQGKSIRYLVPEEIIPSIVKAKRRLGK